MLNNFENNLNIAIIGASGGIGSAFVQHLETCENVENIWALSRSQKKFNHPKTHTGFIDFTDETSIKNAANQAAQHGPLDIVIIATGSLHGAHGYQPEKSLSQLTTENFTQSFQTNLLGPALVAKHFTPHLNKNRHSIFAALSARVGSISDNGLGGWYSYRSSKAGLNMLLKTTSIEVARKNKHAVIIGLHPGTTDTDLSKPFQGNVPQGKLFTPAHSASCLLKIINNLTPQDSGNVLDWAGEKIPA